MRAVVICISRWRVDSGAKVLSFKTNFHAPRYRETLMRRRVCWKSRFWINSSDCLYAAACFWLYRAAWRNIPLPFLGSSIRRAFTRVKSGATGIGEYDAVECERGRLFGAHMLQGRLGSSRLVAAPLLAPQNWHGVHSGWKMIHFTLDDPDF